MRKLLIVEDDLDIQYSVKKYLEKRDFSVDLVSTIDQAKKEYHPKYDVILLDLNLPDGSGLDLFQYIKIIDDTPIICLTVKNDEETILSGFDAGADDYITKPFKLSILHSRIEAVVKRTMPLRKEKEGIILYQDLVLDINKMELRKSGLKVDLSSQEYELIKLLMENPKATLTRERILEQVWDLHGNFVNDNTLTATIKRIREKIGKETIVTVRGIGYRLAEGWEEK